MKKLTFKHLLYNNNNVKRKWALQHTRENVEGHGAISLLRQDFRLSKKKNFGIMKISQIS